ncbi:hypothetical protein BUALT_Bualt12G0064900 [Buddleja alternifolia]|uniref:Uncharacterized protein n=1 Tax=Buddleja alternifolia TaxID=168488 RepID=A0AAV6WPC1_9LAMI|nr:hypothetical protein BUALT_Bualt12G0064900 [Buddleja alternifolia]
MATFDSVVAPPPSAAQRSPWHSPVPYLFGGLAAMLGLIAFALLILACSYWKLSGYLENRGDGERDLEAGEADGGEDGGAKAAPPVMEEKFLVIMAGQAKPTFLATPMSSRNSSFGSKSTCSTSTSSSSSENCGTTSSEEDCEEKKIENGGQIGMGNIEEAHEAADQVH